MHQSSINQTIRSITNSTMKICVVGGGPAGAAVAMFLSQTGHTVHLFEAYQSPLTIQKNSPKAYVISMSARGQKGLERATGIRAQDVADGIVTGNLARHGADRSKLKLMRRPFPALVAPRKVLTAHILQQAAEKGVQIHYQHRLIGIDFKERVASFETTDGKTTKKSQQSYDLLIGADGSKSMVRTLLDQNNEIASDFSVTRVEQDSMEYQVAVLPGTRLNTDTVPENTVHTWNNKKYNAICLGFPIVAEDRGTLFAAVFPEGKFEEFKKTADGFDDPLACLFPDLSREHRDALAQQYRAGTPANGGLCVWCSSLGSPKAGVALVGDAAHGMWPSLGQGANCALETAAVFCETVRDVSRDGTTSSDWSSDVVAEFNRRRHADAIAAVDLTYGGIGARKSRGRGNSPLSYKLQVAGMMLLHKLTAGLVPKPALLRLMGGDDLPYSTARKYNFYYEKMICLAGLMLFSAPVVWYKLAA